MNSRKNFTTSQLRRTSLAIGLGLCIVGTSALAQSTTGSIFGQAQAGATVLIKSTSGISRQVAVDSTGHYTASALPLGDYTVTLQRDGQTVDSRSNVTLRVGSGTEVSFGAQGAKDLTAVTVQANALPTIDVSAVDSRTVITSEQLAKLPIGRSAEAIALLAPGVVPGSSLITGSLGQPLVSFGGSSVTENAYYVNGFNTTDPLSGLGGLALPYGAIDQQEILTGGYDAAYGRSDGGVISQVGKRGTNEWHFGAQIQWTPTDLQSDPRNFYYVKPSANHDPSVAGPQGAIRQYRKDNKAWTTTVDAYVGGPLIQDKLFFFAAVEGQRQQGTSVAAVSPNVVKGFDTHYRYDNPKWYGKLDWNITDSNILELTGASSKQSYQGAVDNYSYVTHTDGAFSSNATSTKTGSDLYSAKFTSYITDDLSLTALYGKMKGTLYSTTPGYDPNTIALLTPNFQNPALNGNRPIINNQNIVTLANPAHRTTNTNLRIDLSYKLGDHTITGGIDNQNVADMNDGTVTSGPGYAWEYGASNGYITGAPGTDPFVAAPTNGYYVDKYIFGNNASVRTTQRAQYIQDTWQVTDRWLVKAGLRNDQFTNFNGNGVPYLRLTTPQWAPRVGFSWDVNGDSSFKVYGNAGRYYLAMPSTVALRSAGASIYTREYFNYTGIDANGYPTGLSPIATSTGGPISANLEYGIPRDPKTATSTNLRSEYQDEYILGFDKKLGDSWAYGAKATYRNLRNAIDDIGDSDKILAKMDAMGINPASYDPNAVQGSYLINPGSTSIFEIAKLGGGYYTVPVTWKEFGFNTTLKRKYYGLDLYLEHPFDGKWFGKVDYLYSKSYGNSEGQVRSDIGQTDVSATVDWDYAEVMDYANGNLSNDRRHQLKAFGAYQLAPEWMVSGNLQVLSGSPQTCLGRYGVNQTNPSLGYGPYYHWCNGVPFSPGKTHNPWTYTLSLGGEYRPEWAGKKLAFNMTVYNVLNSQRTTQTYAIYGDSRLNGAGQPSALNVSYLRPYSAQTPRYVRFGISYDF
ncbi:Oar protein [Rhodanobacter panaciterrae]|uniref:Oar protein n=1 Tax=Rhodanobacter panaciterrae TaxID=490572 RepID=A0ABQ3A3I6_9GAMM|nr:TonB-dependent receptor [Rhodanobacter panaciterrae]GGY31979.1 Oar protein [Rhodanobacter panaciterrae]